MSSFAPSICLLFDNGSLRAASTLSLRETAKALQPRIDVPVKAVSLLHSSGVSADQLGGVNAELVEPFLQRWAESGGQNVLLLPLFFGPSAALTEYLPERLEAQRKKYPAVRVRLAAPLVQAGDDSAALVARAIHREVKGTVADHALTNPRVLLTDHGSPQPAVAHVRDLIAGELGALVRDENFSVRATSMERRAGPDYAFNDPLLEQALAEIGASGGGDVVVALQFLQAGRHAGMAGDIAQICATAAEKYPRLRIKITKVIGRAPEVQELLWRRWQAAISSDA
ncbi:sirohydrochlorin chelatase [Synoicihabitans lomoniglobus]|uniref:CbiX/SirB N-terminal domain-containing protein n=1 Tax=Synoicihabitans lomoniglobus TaxID=2909285 RepID=A0AAF0CRU1_9BACT|nr:cobalamin biosynthesis protein CbiX [Opitutaceae bacterium LMO-M01]WED66873.1 CbiX/SirB N-terminal domain-containing protein [Opitutaceae bacterium LMO-M01]